MSKPAERKAGIGAVFWITFILFGLLVLIGVFIWMFRRHPLPTNPERPNSAIWTEPLRNAQVPYRVTTRHFARSGWQAFGF